MKNDWTEHEDYYYNEQGFIVLTAKYHLKRGHCCGNGCLHCPYEHINVPDGPASVSNQVSAKSSDSGNSNK